MKKNVSIGVSRFIHVTFDIPGEHVNCLTVKFSAKFGENNGHNGSKIDNYFFPRPRPRIVIIVKEERAKELFDFLKTFLSKE